MDTLKVVCDILGKRIGQHVEGTESFCDLGINSLEFVRFIVELEEIYQIEIPIERVIAFKLDNIVSFTNFLKEQLSFSM